MELQRIFKKSYVNTLRDSVKSGKTLPLYGKDYFEIDNKYISTLASIYKPEHIEKDLEGLENDDYKAAIIVYEAYKDISPLIASSEAFWTYITHTSMFRYTQHRYPKVLSQDADATYILNHWFIGPNGIMRNAVASLWWAVKNTVDENRANKYELTSILLKNYTLRTTTFGTYSLIRHREAMIGILSFLYDNPEIVNNNLESRGNFILKYFNRLGAVKQLCYLDRNFFRERCERMKDKILIVKSRNQLKDESLYND